MKTSRPHVVVRCTKPAARKNTIEQVAVDGEACPIYHDLDHSGPSATAIDYFTPLPEQGYDLIIIRAHHGSSQAIITTESYSRSEYLAEQLDGRLVPAQVGSGPVYFALTPRFVHQDMIGSFPGST